MEEDKVKEYKKFLCEFLLRFFHKSRNGKGIMLEDYLLEYDHMEREIRKILEEGRLK